MQEKMVATDGMGQVEQRLQLVVSFAEIKNKTREINITLAKPQTIIY